MSPILLYLKKPEEDENWEQTETLGSSSFIETKKKVEEEEGIFCSQCGNLITYPYYEIIVNGSHTHIFKNPANVHYSIRCFNEAFSINIQGEPVIEFTWFEGYLWQICLCGKCSIHIGWRYSNSKDVFYGLIENRLVDS